MNFESLQTYLAQRYATIHVTAVFTIAQPTEYRAEFQTISPNGTTPCSFLISAFFRTYGRLSKYQGLGSPTLLPLNLSGSFNDVSAAHTSIPKSNALYKISKISINTVTNDNLPPDRLFLYLTFIFLPP